MSLAARLAAGEALTALMAKLPCAAQVELAGQVGFDLVILDTEHGPNVALEEHLRAADAAALPALVRVGATGEILAALDAGATGVVVPHVLDAAGAEAAVAAAHYPPRGSRGLALSTRAGRHGTVSLDAHLRRSADETCVIVQIEDREAVEAADAILAVPGVSAVLIGAADLAMSLGHSPEAEVEAVIAAAGRVGVPVMTVASTTTEARRPGVQAVAYVTTNLIRDAFREAVTAARTHEPGSVESSTAATRAAPGHRDVAGDGVALPGALPTTPSAVDGPQAAATARTTPLSGAGPRPAAAPCAPRARGREPLVLLPGMLGDASLWDDVAPALADVAMVRFGRIDFDDTIAGMAATVLASAPDRFALAGHSLGGIVALEIVRQAPGRVSRLALLNTSARPASDAQLSAWEAMRAGAFDHVAREFAQANGRDGTVERVEAMARAVGSRVLDRQLRAQATRPDSRPSLARIAVPTLVVTGAEDQICPRPLQEELAATLPRPEYVVIEGAGHMTPLEQGATVAAHLRTWLETP
jgi:4-hydroxy-2-oxoheptanedioate aldolase